MLSANMDIEQKRSAVIALFLAGKCQKDIVRELSAIPVCRSFVHRTVKRYLETGSTKKRYGGGRQATVVTPAMVKIVKKRLKRNPRRSATKLAKDLNISDRSLRRILKDKLQTKPYKIQKVQDLSMRQKQERVKRAKALLKRAAEGRLENIVFTDEKLFTVEQFVNKQNDRVWLPERSRTHADVLTATRRQKPWKLWIAETLETLDCRAFSRVHCEFGVAGEFAGPEPYGLRCLEYVGGRSLL